MADSTEENQHQEEEGDGTDFTRYLWIGVGGLVALVALIFLAGVGLALFTDPQQTALRLGLVRDAVIIIIVLEGLLIILALATLTLQITRLVVMLRNDTAPILEDAQETVRVVKGTAQFASRNIARPIMGIHAGVSGVITFIREVGGIRRAIRPSARPVEIDDHAEQ